MPIAPTLTLSGTFLTESNDIISQIDSAMSSSYFGGWKFEYSLSGSFSGSGVIGNVRDHYMAPIAGSSYKWTSVEFQNPTSGTTKVILRSNFYR